MQIRVLTSVVETKVQEPDAQLLAQEQKQKQEQQAKSAVPNKRERRASLKVVANKEWAEKRIKRSKSSTYIMPFCTRGGSVVWRCC